MAQAVSPTRRQHQDSSIRAEQSSVAATVCRSDLRGIRLNQKTFIDWASGWARAFPDGRITNAHYVDAGDVVIAEYTIKGTHKGSFVGLHPTRRKVSFSYCGITRFDRTGRIISGSGYYDLYTILAQLGCVQPFEATAV